MKFFIRSGAAAWARRLVCVFALWMAFASGPALAVPLLWTLNDVTFNGGGTASGSFRFDADTASYSDVSVTTAGGGSLDASFDFAAEGDADFLNLLNEGDGPDFNGAPTLRLRFLDLLTDAGGEVGLQLNSFFTGAAGCGNADCSIVLSSLQGQFVSGSVIREAVAQVPEPGSLVMLMLGLGLLGLKRRNEARNKL